VCVCVADLVFTSIVGAVFANYAEVRALVPAASLSQATRNSVASTLTFTLSYSGYSDICGPVSGNPPQAQAVGIIGACNSAISFTTSCISNSSAPLAVGLQAGGLTCQFSASQNVAPVCAITWTCTSCSILSTTATVTITSQQTFALAYQLGWAFTSSTGIWQQQTSYQSQLYGNHVPPPSMAFRGPTPSVIALTATPTTFQGPADEDASGFGYHTSYSGFTPGSSIDEVGFQYATGLSTTLSINKPEVVFQITQTIVLSTILIIMSILGGVSGASGLTSGLFATFEEYQLKWFGPKSFRSLPTDSLEEVRWPVKELDEETKRQAHQDMALFWRDLHLTTKDDDRCATSGECVCVCVCVCFPFFQ